MKVQEFDKQRKALLKEREAAIKSIDKRYNKIVKKFIEAHSPVKEGVVYELVKDGIKRRGFKRFVIYDLDVTSFTSSDRKRSHYFIRAAGWWLNEDNVPTKRDDMTVFGVGNPAVFKESDNQEHKPHPEADKK